MNHSCHETLRNSRSRQVATPERDLGGWWNYAVLFLIGVAFIVGLMALVMATPRPGLE